MITFGECFYAFLYVWTKLDYIMYTAGFISTGNNDKYEPLAQRYSVIGSTWKKSQGLDSSFSIQQETG